MATDTPTPKNPTAWRLGQRLQAIRKAKGMTLQQLANECGVQHQRISHIEHGYTDIAVGKLDDVLYSLGCELTIKPIDGPQLWG